MIYDKREIFTFEDGGKIAIDFMGELFQTRDHLYAENEDESKAPLMFIVPGLTSDDQCGYIKDMVN